MITKIKDTYSVEYCIGYRQFHNPHGPAYKNKFNKYTGYWLNRKRQNIVGPAILNNGLNSYWINGARI